MGLPPVMGRRISKCAPSAKKNPETEGLIQILFDE